MVLDDLDAPPVLLGHSMGSLTVKKYLESHEVPAAVLLVSVPPSAVITATFRVLFRHPVVFLKANLTFSIYPIVSTLRLAQDPFFSSNMPYKQENSYFSNLQDDSY